MRYRGGGESVEDLVQVASRRAAEGDRPLRPRARLRLRRLRRADHPRRAAAPLPRPLVERSAAAEPAGALDADRRGLRGDPRPGAPRRRPSGRSPSSATSTSPRSSRRCRPTGPAGRPPSTSPRRAARRTRRRWSRRSSDRRARLRAGRVGARQRGRRAAPEGAAGAPPPLPRGPDPARDRRADRRLADAGLAAAALRRCGKLLVAVRGGEEVDPQTGRSEDLAPDRRPTAPPPFAAARSASRGRLGYREARAARRSSATAAATRACCGHRCVVNA